MINNTNKQEYRQLMNRAMNAAGCELWDLGERIELPKICESSIYFEPLFYYQSGRGLSIFYNFTDPKQNVDSLVNYFNRFPNKLFELKGEFSNDCEEIRRITRDKNLEDADRLFRLMVKVWPLIAVSNILGDDSRENVSGVDKGLAEEFINIRKESDGVLHLGEMMLVEFIRDMIPLEHKSFADLILYSEIKENRLPDLKKLKMRKEKFVFFKGEIFSGQTLDEFALKNNLFIKTDNEVSFDENVDEIVGRTAYPGKCRGIAKIIFERKDVDKIENGDIMISPMTTPDLVSAMEKAGAFVTDEGGITCHAAIVARELKKPCIIGTKIATQVLKDGDEVEVDADKGVVKIIKKA